MPSRHYKTGKRRDTAEIQRHNGNTDNYGQPTYTIDADWETFVRWPCQLEGAKGGEFLRGRQVTSQASNVLYGDYMAVRDVQSTDRIKIRGQVLGILDVSDLFGDRREMVIDAKRET